jgi:hypothetical protein
MVPGKAAPRLRVFSLFSSRHNENGFYGFNPGIGKVKRGYFEGKRLRKT